MAEMDLPAFGSQVDLPVGLGETPGDQKC